MLLIISFIIVFAAHRSESLFLILIFFLSLFLLYYLIVYVCVFLVTASTVYSREAILSWPGRCCWSVYQESWRDATK